MDFTGRRVLIMGGTGSLGQKLVRRILTGEMGKPAKVTVFSRDEAKQHHMRLEYLNREPATDEVIYLNSQDLLNFKIGDVRDYASVLQAVQDADIVFYAAALKQVPTCEYFPYEAVQTNVTGAYNVVRAIRSNRVPVELAVGISTDKACKPINVMGMSKALQERVFIQASMDCPDTRFICVRYGNVIASRGSVIPLFLKQVEDGGPVTITHPEMTRFLLSLDQAVDTIFSAVRDGLPGETYVPRVRSARVVDIAQTLIGDRDIQIKETGIRPGEKIHEILVSEEECFRTVARGDYYVIFPILPEMRAKNLQEETLAGEYSSRDSVIDHAALSRLLEQYGYMTQATPRASTT